MKAKHRSAIGISKEELIQAKNKAAEFHTELLMISGYIGYVDIWNDTLRMYVFEKDDKCILALKAADQIGLESAGMINDFVCIRNSELERPHLSKRRGHSYYRELYR